MNFALHDKIREAIETTPGLTQKGLAERMGLNPAAINRMLYGRRHIMAEEIPMIEDYLGIRLALSAPVPGFIPSPAPSRSAPGNLVPVYTDRAQDPVGDWVARHPAQTGIASAFALYVSSQTMEPRYFQGELVYVHPGRPPEMNRDCIIEMKNGGFLLKRFLRQNEETIHVAQFNPPLEKHIPRAEIKAVYAVVGRG